MNIHVKVFGWCGDPVVGYSFVVANYVMDHNDPAQRRVLGEQCRNAFEGGQTVITSPA